MEMSLAQAEAAAYDILDGFFDVLQNAAAKHGTVSSVVISGAVGAMMAAAMEGGFRGNLLLFYRWRDHALETINRHFEIAASRIAAEGKAKTSE